MFFTRWDPAVLERAHLDGTNRTILVSNKIIDPVGLTLDLANQHIYWIDSYMDFVERSDYNGQNRRSIKKTTEHYSSIKSIYSIAKFDNQIFVSAWNLDRANQSIIVMDKHQTFDRTIVSNVRRPGGLLVFHRQQQPEVAHPCRTLNGGCSQLCIPMWRNHVASAQCLCGPGYRLQSKTNCVLIKLSSFLVYSKQNPNMIKGIAMSTSQQPGGDNQEAMVPILKVQSPVRLDYNVREQLIYFGQINMTTNEFDIESQKIDGTDRRIIVARMEHESSITYDWMGHNIYWASSHKIGVISLTNSSVQKTLLHTITAG